MPGKSNILKAKVIFVIVNPKLPQKSCTLNRRKNRNKKLLTNK